MEIISQKNINPQNNASTRIDKSYDGLRSLKSPVLHGTGQIPLTGEINQMVD